MRFGAQQHLMTVWRQPRLLAFGKQLFCGETISVCEQAAQKQMIGMMGLQQHSSRLARASRASGNLHDQLRQAFARAEVDAQQTFVHPYDGD
jgi:hypothetical protein